MMQTCTCTNMYTHYMTGVRLTSLIPRPLPREERGPGIHCLHMCETIPGIAVTRFTYRAESSGRDKTKSSGRSVRNNFASQQSKSTDIQVSHKNPRRCANSVYQTLSLLVGGPGYEATSNMHIQCTYTSIYTCIYMGTLFLAVSV